MRIPHVPARRSRLRACTAVGVAVAALAMGLSALSPPPAQGFGTIASVPGIAQDKEHTRITTGALECPGRPRRLEPDLPGRCFETTSILTLAGDPSSSDLYNVGAVGAPDIDEFFLDAAHCTDGDFLPTPGYPHTRAAAAGALARCRTYMRNHWVQAVKVADDLVTKGPIPAIVPREVRLGCQFANERKAQRDWERAALVAKGAIEKRVLIVGSVITGALQGLTPRLTSAKCKTVNHLGRMYHTMEDFYSHSNWADVADPLRATGVTNPPGLASAARAPFLDMTRANATISSNMFTTCYALPGSGNCRGRMDHDDHLGKDNGQVTIVPGRCPGACRTDVLTTAAPGTPRGRVTIGQVTNFDLAVQGALKEVRGSWTDFGSQLIAKYGRPRGTLMICAITHDDPVIDCSGSGTALPPPTIADTTTRPPTTTTRPPTTTTTTSTTTSSSTTTSTSTTSTTTTTPVTTTFVFIPPQPPGSSSTSSAPAPTTTTTPTSTSTSSTTTSSTTTSSTTTSSTTTTVPAGTTTSSTTTSSTTTTTTAPVQIEIEREGPPEVCVSGPGSSRTRNRFKARKNGVQQSAGQIRARTSGPGVVSGGDQTLSLAPTGVATVDVAINSFGTYLTQVTFEDKTQAFEQVVGPHANAC